MTEYLIGIPLTYIGANLIGWLSVRLDPGLDRPFNWRFIWLPAYHRWNDRRIASASEALARPA